MKTRELSFVCADNHVDTLNISFGDEPGLAYFEVDHAESFLSGVWLDASQLMDLRDELSSWLEKNT